MTKTTWFLIGSGITFALTLIRANTVKQELLETNRRLRQELRQEIGQV